MDIDLKNINMSDIKDQITKLADKKTLIKIGIIFGAIVFFLIVYYAILNPMVESRKAKLDDMNLKIQETAKFTSEIYSMRARIKKLKPDYEKYSSLFHSKAEVEGLYQTLSEYAGQNDLVITRIEKKVIQEVLKAQALAQADGKKTKKKKNNQVKNVANIAYYLIPVDFEIDGNFIGYIKFKRVYSGGKRKCNWSDKSKRYVNNSGVTK